MSINFSEKQSKQKYLIIVLIIVILVTLFTMRDKIIKFFTPVAAVTEVFLAPKIEVDFGLLQNEVLKGLKLPEPEKPFDGKSGRENPFLPY